MTEMDKGQDSVCHPSILYLCLVKPDVTPKRQFLSDVSSSRRQEKPAREGANCLVFKMSEQQSAREVATAPLQTRGAGAHHSRDPGNTRRN